jgi:hypothetical protein
MSENAVFPAGEGSDKVNAATLLWCPGFQKIFILYFWSFYLTDAYWNITMIMGVFHKKSTGSLYPPDPIHRHENDFYFCSRRNLKRYEYDAAGLRCGMPCQIFFQEDIYGTKVCAGAVPH